MRFDARAQGRHRGALDVVDQLHCMRVAHREHRDLHDHAVDIQRLDHGTCSPDERNLAGTEPRHAHVDAHLAVRFDARHDQPSRGLDADLALAGQAVLANEDDEAARPVAALLDLAAVRVEDAVAEICVPLRRLDHQDLVAADAEAPVSEAADIGGSERERRARCVDDDEIVAQSLHLGEPQRSHREGPTSPLFENGRLTPPAKLARP